MLIYKGSIEQFFNDVRFNKIADIMQKNHFDYSGYKVSDPEYRSWQNSLNHVKNVLEVSGLKDNMIQLEYQIPYNTSRIDCLIFGEDASGQSNAVLVELKQWDHVSSTDIEGNYVETFVGKRQRIVAHPSQQVQGYHNYLLNFVQEFEKEPPFYLTSFSYCHNYSRTSDESGLFAEQYGEILKKYPVYCKEDVEVLAHRLRNLLQYGHGTEIFNRFMRSPIRPGKKLLEHAHKVITNEPVFSLINEQVVARNVIVTKLNQAQRKKEKSVVIVEGGPGTGKSVIALNILAEAAGRNKTVSYACKSKSFTEGLKKMVGRKAGMLFNNLYRFVPSKVSENEYDLLLVDEAHRIEQTSNFQYTRKEDRTDMPQMEQLIRAAKTSVFFVDNLQNVRRREIGSTFLIRRFADKLGAKVHSVKLESQFRCMGSNDYLEWVESVLGLSGQSKNLEASEVFDFQIVESPQELYRTISKREKAKANSARLVAGYCWEWSDPKPDGTLVDDVQIGDFSMPWEAKAGKKIQKGIPFWYQWAYHPGGINQVGCIYTAQGFEFEYIGVIIGADLKYDPSNDSLIGDISATQDPTLKHDKENFDQFVKNIYRVLLTRGLKGCYVYFVDKGVEKYFRQRIS